MNWKYFIGIDVSKLTLDICILLGREKVFSGIVDNHPKALEKLWAQLLKTLPGFMPEDVVCCLEHTGIYNEHLLSFLVTKKTAICLENPTHIKFSGGMTRGKNDQVDAERIAVFAYKERDSLRLWEPPRTVIKTLKYLSVLRIRLINAKKSLVVPQNEVRSFDKQAAKIMSVLSKSTLKHIEKDLINVENKILEIIKQDDTLKRLYAITTSVTGIGMVTAVEIIITTNEFKNIDNAQKICLLCWNSPISAYLRNEC